MHYTLHQLKIFTKTCEVQSITKASEDLHLTQPAVSIQLKKLQDQFEIPLIEVVGRQLYVTEFGKQIEKLALEILDKADEIKTTTDEYKGYVSGKIRISSASTGKYVIPYFLSDFMKEFPGVEISVDVTNKEKVVQSVQDNATDFALVSVIPENLSVEKVSLLPNELFLVGSTDYIKENPKISLKNLHEHRLIFREKGSATLAAMMQFLNKNNIRPTKTMELVSNEATKQAVRAGLGLSIMPRIGIRNEIKHGSMEIIKLKGLPITTSWYLIYAQGKKLTPASNAFANYISEHKERLIQENF